MKIISTKGEIATTLLLLSIGALLLGTGLGIKQYNGRKSEPLQSNAQSTCRYTSHGYLKDRQGNVVAITSESDDNLKTYLEYQFTSNTGQYYEGKAKYLNGLLNSTSIFDYNYDMGDGKGKFIDVPVTAAFKRDRDKYNLYGWECRDKTSVSSCDKPRYTGGDGKESLVVRTKCGAVNDYWFIVEPKQGVNITPDPSQPTITPPPYMATPTVVTRTQPTSPPSDQVCRAINSACAEEFTETCASGTRTCRKIGTCSGVGGGELCSWDTGSCCGPCTDPAGNNESTVDGCLSRPFPPAQPNPTQGQGPSSNSISWNISNTADASHNISQIGIALYKNGQYQRDYLSYPGTIENMGGTISDLDLNAEYKIEPRAKKPDGVTNVSTVIQEISNCTNKDGSQGSISSDKKSCTLKPGGSIVLLIRNPSQPQPRASDGSIQTAVTANFNPGTISQLIIGMRQIGTNNFQDVKVIGGPISGQTYFHSITGLDTSKDYEIYVKAIDTNGNSTGTRLLDLCSSGQRNDGESGGPYCKLKPINDARANFTINSTQVAAGKVSGTINFTNNSNTIYTFTNIKAKICNGTVCLAHDVQQAGSLTLINSTDSRHMTLRYEFNRYPAIPPRPLQVGDSDLRIRIASSDNSVESSDIYVTSVGSNTVVNGNVEFARAAEPTPVPQKNIQVAATVNAPAGTIDRLEFYYREEGDNPVTNFKTVGGVVRGMPYLHTLTGLDPNTRYDIWVEGFKGDISAGKRNLTICEGVSALSKIGDYGRYCAVKPSDNSRANFTVDSTEVSTASTNAIADFNGDKQIDTQDFFAAKRLFGQEVNIRGTKQRISAVYMSLIIGNMGLSVK